MEEIFVKSRRKKQKDKELNMTQGMGTYQVKDEIMENVRKKKVWNTSHSTLGTIQQHIHRWKCCHGVAWEKVVAQIPNFDKFIYLKRKNGL